MAWRLRTPHGKQLYGLRKQTPEPVFGIIKSVIGFRQFLLRGLDRVRGEWSLVTMAWNIKRCMRSAWAERSPSAALEPRRGCPKISPPPPRVIAAMFVGEIYELDPRQN